MPHVLAHPASPDLPPELPRRQFTRDDCAALEKSGLLDRERFELIAGELVRKMGKGPIHNVVVGLLLEWLKRIFGADRVLQEASFDATPELAAVNEPEPDALVFRVPYTSFRTSNARPADILLVCEVSVTTLAYDLGAKAALYARAGIAEYWVLDITGERLYVHRTPVDGVYRSIIEYSADEPVAPLAAPGAIFRLRGLLA